MSDLSAPGGASVSRFGVEMYATGATSATWASRRSGSVDVLDRLQEDHGVNRIVEVLHQAAPEAQVGPPVAGASVLERLGVGVDTDHLGGALGQQVRPVSLTAGEVRDAQPGAARGDPLVHGDVTPVPIVLLGNVRERALAGELERRYAVGLVHLQVGPVGSVHRRGR